MNRPHHPPHRRRRSSSSHWLVERLEDRRLLAATPFDLLVFSRTTGFRHPSIDEGVAAIRGLGAANNFTVQATEDPAAFNDANLAQFEAVVFLNTTGDPLNDAQQAAFERYIGAGGGYVGVHAAADTEYNWAWYGGLVGAYFQSHPAIQQATVKVADRAHPASAGLPQRWTRTDEWYNYRLNPRGNVHVLATLDETTYNPGTGAMGADHPIAWVQEYQGGRAFYTGMGHTEGSYTDANFRRHLLGGIEYATGAVEADDGATVWSNYQKVVLDQDTLNPMQIDLDDQGRVFLAERGGAVKLWSPATGTTSVVANIPVFAGAEDGLLGLALDPNFQANKWVYVFYAAPSPAEQHVSRFTFDETTRQFVPGSERVILRIPVQRTNSNHSAGALDFGPDGLLYISTGDNTNPFASSGYAPIDERPGRSDWDAQKSSANTNDLRGKILRIRPQSDGTYTIPAGNLFAPGTPLTKPEIYTMGHRNPFRFSVDPETNWLYLGDVGPDAQNDGLTTPPLRGPRGHDEWNQVRQAGNYGWPHFVGNNKPYYEYDFATNTSGAPYNPAAPVNNSPNNTGQQNLPPAQSAWIWYPYANSAEFPELVPLGGRTAMGGPVFHHDPADTARGLPAYFDDTLFIYEWSRQWIKEVKIDAATGAVLKINPFLPNMTFRRPMDMKIGPDGAMYLLEWGTSFGGGNADSQLVRIDYVRDTRPPAALASADRDNGAVPLTVNFSSAGTDPGDRGPLTYAWDFNGDDVVDSAAPNPTFTYTQPGNFTARLVVTDTAGLTSQSNVPIAAGNTRPDVSLLLPPDGSFFAWSQFLPYSVAVTDAEDGSIAAGTIDGTGVVAQPLLGHDDHAHPLLEYPGPSGVFPTEAGHGGGADNIFQLVEARYTDRGAPGVQPLTGFALSRLQPRRKQAEHFTSASPVLLSPTNDVDGGMDVTGIDYLEYIAFKPVNLQNIDRIRYRYIGSVGVIEVHADSPTGPLLSFWQPSTTTSYNTLSVPVTNPGGTRELFFVFRTPGANFRLNWIEFDRNNNTAPAAAPNSYTLPAGARLDVPRASGVLANDVDNQNDALFAGALTPPAHGRLHLNPDGSFAYTPDAGYAGPDSFTYFAHDYVNGSTPATVTLNVTVPQVTDVFLAGGAWTATFKQFLAARGLGDAAYGWRVNAAEQLNELPWTNLNQVSVRFSEPVSAEQADLALGGAGGGAYATAGFSYDPATRTATWSLARPVGAERLLLDLASGTGPAGVANAGGTAAFDGEWAGDGAGPDAFPSGDGLPGGNFRFRLNALPGDVDRDGAVNIFDTLAVRNRQGTSTTSPGTDPNTYSVFHDVDGNGAINIFDTLAVRNRQGSGLPAGAPAATSAGSLFAVARVRADEEDEVRSLLA